MGGENLTGNFRIRAIRPAFDDVNRLFRKTSDKIEVRRHALKLCFWPEKHPADESGRVLDLDWTWIRTLPGLKIGELRIDDAIGGHDNLRVIFFEGDTSVRASLPVMWVLRVMQKKRDDFSSHDLSIFRSRRVLVMERFYES